MPDEPFQMLSHDDQREARQVAAGRSGRPAYLIEKDIWVVWTLRSLVNASFGEELTFKGGTKNVRFLVDTFSWFYILLCFVPIRGLIGWV